MIMFRKKVNILFAFVLCLMLGMANKVMADPITIYVRPTGSYNNQGTAWDDAKLNLQDAINTLREQMRLANDTIGYIYVADGTYVPTESTEQTGGSILNTAFKVYEGIRIFGGFHPELNETGHADYTGQPQDRPGDRIMGNGKTWDENMASIPEVGTTTPEQVEAFWLFKYKSILSGNHANAEVEFTFDKTRGRYEMRYPANSFHVVWFGTNGRIEDSNIPNHFKPLAHKAVLDGFTIEDGNAASRVTSGHDHMAYGGGVYMVKGSRLENCIVRRCASTMRGGGVYMDGGGEMEHCWVHTCQSTGVGIVQGYGGGVCIDYDGYVRYTYLNHNSARIGAGISICHVPDEYPWQARGDAQQISPYSPYVTSSVIVNNTSTAEGGGIFLDEGGTINHCTVVKNNCVGPDIIYYGRRHGRSGGIYVRNCGMMYNSVFWGNEVAANNNLQFASFKEATATASDIISVYHCGFESHNITDWSESLKDQVYNVEKKNMPVPGTSGIYPCFSNPAVAAGILCNADGSALKESEIRRARAWILLSITGLAEKGVQVTEAVQGVSEWVKHAHSSTGIVGSRFEPVSSLGALVRENEKVQHTLVSRQSKEQAEGAGTLPTLFVDPQRKAARIVGSDTVYTTATVGNSWETPLKNLGDAINYFGRYLDQTDPDNIHYTIDGVDYPYVQILVKEGELTTAGPGNYLNQELRTASVRVISHMRIYAAYPSTLTGTNTEGRSPRKHITRITANITGGNDELAFSNHSAHVISFINAKNAIVDGFRLYEANSHKLNQYTLSVEAGAGVLVNNENTAQADRIDMTGNQVRNCVIANNYAPKGVAVYVNGEFPKANGEISRAELILVNTIVRNNTADYVEGQEASNHGIITANGRAFVDVDHCTICNNVGYPLKADNKTTDTNSPIAGYHGYIRVSNSIVFANGDKILDERSMLGTVSAKVMSVNQDGENYVFGSNNLFDYDVTLPAGFTDAFSLSEITGFGTPTFSLLMPDGTAQNNKAILTRDSRNDRDYPVFENPSNNVGHSIVGDKPLYGGIVSYMPMNMNPCVNAANSTNYIGYGQQYWNTDQSAVEPRTYGGLPDIGALENVNLPEYGSVKYVRMPKDGGSDLNDGNSWGTAFATIKKAIESCDELSGQEIWVAAGKYQKATTDDDDYLVLKDGVSLFGGFVRYGNPGKDLNPEERMVGNNELYDGTVDEENTVYQTIIDGNAHGRVVSMTDNFRMETVVEGFTIQNGHNPKKNENEPIQVTMWTKNAAGDYVPDTQNYPSTYYAQVSSSWYGYNTAGYEPTNIGFPRQGKDYRDGGGCRMYGNGVIKSCLIWKNHLRTDGDITFAAGAAMLKGSRMESSIVRNNVVENVLVSGTNFNGITRGAGVHAAGATIINSLIVENVGLNGYSFNGIGIYTSAKSNFYQCTVAYNFGIIGNPSYCNTTGRQSMCIAPGVYDDTQRKVVDPSNINTAEASQFYNCIIWGNAAISRSGYSYAPILFAYNEDLTDWSTGTRTAGIGLKGMVNSSYISVPSELYANATGIDQVYNTNQYSGSSITGSSQTLYGYTNIKAYWDACQAENLFNESESGYKFDPFINTANYIQNYNSAYIDSDDPTYYTAKNIIARASKNPYSINPASDLAQFIVNAGDDNSPAVLEQNYSIAIDIDGADRVQDCQVDKGAFEYDGTKLIEPDVTTYADSAVFYVNEVGKGLASASSIDNAACKQKLQKVLDAAGRYKKEHPELTVQVRISGNAGSSTEYIPLRTTNLNPNQDENILERSIMVPHGVVLSGGYEPLTLDASYNITNPETAFSDKTRDVLYFQSVLSGKVVSVTGSEGQTYHVVTFTDSIYTEDGTVDHTRDLKSLSGESNRAVVDGVILQGGYANGAVAADIYQNHRVAGGALVPDYGHIRNSIVRNNYALTQGGGLYLMPGALVSGTVVTGNSSDYGGGIYVDDSEGANAHIFTSTVCYNTSTTQAGGLFYSSSRANVRVNSSVFWHNESNDLANVAGSFVAASIGDDVYPFSYSAIESRKVEGQANHMIKPLETEGVRWDRHDPYESPTDDVLFYPIEMSSLLSRTGMPYADYERYMLQYTTLVPYDFAGVQREKQELEEARLHKFASSPLVVKDNDFLEIGARALNATFKVAVDPTLVMRRLYVVQPEDLDPVIARMLQDNQYSQTQHKMYAQLGSSFLNPMQFVDDALNYIVSCRKLAVDRTSPAMVDLMNEAQTDPEKAALLARIRDLRNARFEIFVGAGTHYPVTNAQGTQNSYESARTSTFSVPEGVTIIGGLDPAGYSYAQEGFRDFDYKTDVIGDAFVVNESQRQLEVKREGAADTIVLLDFALTDTIRARRPMSDFNQNNIVEPWEFLKQTSLTGEFTNKGQRSHVYHVITCFADSTKLGGLPLRYKSYDPSTGVFSDPIDPSVESDAGECYESHMRRTINFDGLLIKDGLANNIEAQDVYDKTDNPLVSPYNTKTYFRGGGIFVDGNWTHDFDGDHFIPSVINVAQHDIPIMVENCQFTNNGAGNGGAIYSNGSMRLFSSLFTQNFSCGPNTSLDQQYIPWSAGGVIATNGYCGATNCLFANNEAQRGTLPITASPSDDVSEKITDADPRQGAAGVISAAEHSTVRLFNCNFVRNKAVLYPALFNFLSNDKYDRTDRHYIFNSVFWGNEATGLTGMAGYDIPSETRSRFESAYDTYKGDYMNYDVTKREQFVQYKESDNRDALMALGDQIEGLFFCAYESGYALPEVMPLETDNTDYHGMPISQAIIDGTSTSLFVNLQGNHSVILASNNNATAGPNFVLPSDIAGLNGYMQNADWLPSRINNLTDAGWGQLNQTVTRRIGKYVSVVDGDDSEISVADYEALSDAEKQNWTPFYKGELASFDLDGDGNPVGNGIYNYYSKVHTQEYGRNVMPIGYQRYMEFMRENETEMHTMNRISLNPEIGQDKVNVDIGVYEYQYVQIEEAGNEIDTVWVCTRYRGGDRSGLNYENPTTNLSQALNLLLRSWNNHDKYVCLIGSEGLDNPDSETGVYTPLEKIDERLAFHLSIPTGLAGDIKLPDNASAKIDYGIRSITFLGGWSPLHKVRDAEAYPVVFKLDQEDAQGFEELELNQMFYIGDMSHRTVRRNFINDDVTMGNTVVPVTFDGITFRNEFGKMSEVETGRIQDYGGSAIYYSRQRIIDNTGGWSQTEYPLLPFVTEDGDTLPKLTLRNCKIINSGKRDGVQEVNRTPAVRVMGGGGSSLFVNTLFHSNAGMPLYVPTAQYIDNVDINADVYKDFAPTLSSFENRGTVVNCTFALNHGHLTLENKNGRLMNSVIWQDNYPDADTGADSRTYDASQPQFEIGTSSSTLYTQASVGNKHIQYNAVTDMVEDVALHNISLSTENTSVFNGPNFLEPITQAVGKTQREARNFRVNPSVRILNAASDTLYAEQALLMHLGSAVSKDSLMSRLSSDLELAYISRRFGQGIERGAYECTAVVQRMLYLNPSAQSTVITNATGHSWGSGNEFGGGDMQRAIDVASVYSNFDPGKMAYIFVKQPTNGEQVEESVVLRDGVAMIGSIPTTFYDTAFYNYDQNRFDDDEVERFVSLTRSVQPGIASPLTEPTRLSGISTDVDNQYVTGSLLDGFDIRNTGKTLTSQPVDIKSDYVVLRNCLIHDNRVTGGKPVVNMERGLLYNSLVYDNVGDADVVVGSNGLVLQSTVVNNNGSQTTIDATAAADGSVVNTLTLGQSSGRCAVTGNNAAFRNCNLKTGMFAPYLTEDGNAYTLPDWLRTQNGQNHQLALQLHEKSEYINAQDSSKAAIVAYNAGFERYIAQGETNGFVNFMLDRDALGNPRVLSGKLDIGAYETWLIEDNTNVLATNMTNAQTASASAAEKNVAYKENYGGHCYPHRGSVVYIGKNASLVLAKDGALPLFTGAGGAIRPAYMLLAEGASLYGQGNTVQLPYVAVERKFSGKQALVSLPFSLAPENAVSVTYNASGDALVENLYSQITPYYYDGGARSAQAYKFALENSAAWKKISVDTVAACDGWLADLGASVDTTLRFTGWGADATQYAYLEHGTEKTVRLTQYDNRTAGHNGSGMNFTRKEDMGWNLKGIPYLVSEYRTDDAYTTDIYNMHIPHIFYKMGDDGTYLKAENQVYTGRSWDDGETMKLGEGFFTQTAVISGYEDLSFLLPQFTGTAVRRSPRPLVLLQNTDGEGDILHVVPDEDAQKQIRYSLGRDGVKWMTTQMPQLYMLNDKLDSRLSLVGSAPTETDMQMGVYVPQSADGFNLYTFSLPEKEAFSEYENVWLIDHAKNRVINLMEEDYTLSLPQGEQNKRFTLRIGGVPMGTEDQREYIIYTYDRMLYVRGLMSGDVITVYSTNGSLIMRAVATGSEYSCRIPQGQGTYTVQVNDYGKNVINL